MIEFLKENWTGIVLLLFMVITAIPVYIDFRGKPKDEQIKSIKEWLVYAVTEAEIDLGGGTGQLKLRMVYDMFVSRFPSIAKIVSFATFSVWVDDALVVMRSLLEKNEAVQTLVLGQAEETVE